MRPGQRAGRLPAGAGSRAEGGGAARERRRSAHFNDITGENAYSDVALLIVIGRTEPSPRTVERSARALFGADVAEIPADENGEVRYPTRRARHPHARRHRAARSRATSIPDPRVEAVRWAICEAELIQAIGRGRGVNRTAGNPLQIDILTNVVPADRGRRGDDLGARYSRASPRSCAPAAPCRSATATWRRRTRICSPAREAAENALAPRETRTNSYRGISNRSLSRVSVGRLPPHRF